MKKRGQAGIITTILLILIVIVAILILWNLVNLLLKKNMPGMNSCVPNCTGKYCGPDGCGDYCGSYMGECLGVSETCNKYGQCVDSNYVKDDSNIPNEPVITCRQKSDCGNDHWTGTPLCLGNNIVQNYTNYTCNNAGLDSSYCSTINTSLIIQNCPDGCSGGTCNAITGNCINFALNPVPICTCTDLQNISLNLNLNYSLSKDIDCSETSSWNSGAGFKPIGNSSAGISFVGILFGNNKKISNLFINRPSTDYVGLFGNAYISQSSYGKFYDIGLNNVSIIGKSHVGGLVGFGQYVIINNSYATGNVNGTGDNIGGLVGFGDYIKIFNSYATGNVNGTDNLGGLMGGGNYARINNSYATGNVNGNVFLGGLIGGGYSAKISNSYATGNVNGASNLVGGLVGFGDSVIIDSSYATGNVNGSYQIGGLVGYGYSAVINNSYWNSYSDLIPCVGVGTPASINCIAIQNNQSYFYNSLNPPMTSWNFTDIWKNNNPITYPTLK